MVEFTNKKIIKWADIGPTDLLYVPQGCISMSRPLNGADAYSVRCSFLLVGGAVGEKLKKPMQTIANLFANAGNPPFSVAASAWAVWAMDHAAAESE